MIAVSKNILGQVTISNLAIGQTLYKSSDGGATWFPVVSDLINSDNSITSLDFTQTSVVDYQPYFAWKAIPITGTGNLHTYFSGTCRAAAIVSTSNTSTGSYFTQTNGGNTLPDDMPVTINGTQFASGTGNYSAPIDNGNDDDIGNWMVNWGILYDSLTSLSIGFNILQGPFDIHDVQDWNTIDYPNSEAFVFILVSNFYAPTGTEVGYWQGTGTPPTSFDGTVVTVILGVNRAAVLENDAEIVVQSWANNPAAPTNNPASGYLGNIVATVSLSQNPILFPVMKAMFEQVRTYYTNLTVPSGTPGLNNTNLSNPDYLYDNWIASSGAVSCLEMGRWLSRLYYAWKLTGDSYYLDGINTMSAWVLNSWPTYNNKLQFYNFYDTASGPPNGTYVAASNQYLVLLCGLSMVYLDPGCSLYNNTALYTIIQATVDGITPNINDKGPYYGEFILGSIIPIQKVLGTSDPIVGTTNVNAKLLPFFDAFPSTEPCYMTSDEHNSSNTPQILALRNYWNGTVVDQTAIDIDIYQGGLIPALYVAPTLENIETNFPSGYFGMGNWQIADCSVVMAGYGADVDVLNSWGAPIIQTNRNQQAVANIKNQTNRNQQAVASLLYQTTKNQLSVSRLSVQDVKTITSKSNIFGMAIYGQPATADIEKTTQQTQPAIARLSVQDVKTNSSISRISKTSQHQQNSAAHIQQIMEKYNVSVSNIKLLTARAQSQKSNIQYVLQKNQEGRTRVTVTTKQIQNAITHIIPDGAQLLIIKCSIGNVAIYAQIFPTTMQALRHKLNDGRVIGMELVAPTDRKASAIRIKTSQGILAVKQY